MLTLQKRPVLGILKARGVPTSYLIRSGCAQTLVLSVAGIGIGLLLTIVTSLVLPRAVPFRISALLDLLIVTAFVVVSVIGGFISVRVISRIDPWRPSRDRIKSSDRSRNHRHVPGVGDPGLPTG